MAFLIPVRRQKLEEDSKCTMLYKVSDSRQTENKALHQQRTMGIGFSFCPDVSPATQARRREFLPLKKSFVWERAVQASVLSPAILYVVFMEKTSLSEGHW